MLGRRDRDKILIYLCLYQIQLRKLVVKIRSSLQRCERFQQQLVAAKLLLLELIPDVKTRWNLTELMIERALELWQVCVRLAHLFHFLGA